jgi:hypothetical protein
VLDGPVVGESIGLIKPMPIGALRFSEVQQALKIEQDVSTLIQDRIESEAVAGPLSPEETSGNEKGLEMVGSGVTARMTAGPLTGPRIEQGLQVHPQWGDRSAAVSSYNKHPIAKPPPS